MCSVKKPFLSENEPLDGSCFSFPESLHTHSRTHTPTDLWTPAWLTLLLKLQCVCTSEILLKCGSFSRSGWGLSFITSNRLPSDADATGPRTTSEQQGAGGQREQMNKDKKFVTGISTILSWLWASWGWQMFKANYLMGVLRSSPEICIPGGLQLAVILTWFINLSSGFSLAFSSPALRNLDLPLFSCC